ncbi:hypothetical protein G7046_g1940 [Stylonectria norvegica]|nr:hypothetical protein G7046_g1940 [Stylonectria norvegica]
MPQDPLTDEGEQYASSEDSDFAPEAAPEQVSDHSDSDIDVDKPIKKRSQPKPDLVAVDAGYDNSGDEAIIQKGKKRRKRANAKGADLEDDEGGEGGLIKTRRQRAAEKEERKFAVSSGPVTVDVDALWAQMLAGNPAPSRKANEDEVNGEEAGTKDGNATINDGGAQTADAATSNDDPSAMIRIKRTYNFAGRAHTEEKLVARDSAEAKLYLASNGEAVAVDEPLDKRITKKAFRSAFEPLTDPLPQRGDLNLGMAARMKAGMEAKKLNTVEKSRMDWAGYVDKEGIQDELQLAGKSKESYNAREDFLARSEWRRDEESRRARMAGRT